MIRCDRTLAIRLASYAKIQPETIAKTKQDVIRIIEQSRSRYLVTTTSFFPNNDNRPFDMKLLHDTALSDNEMFSLVSRFKIKRDFGTTQHADVFLWRYEGYLPKGKSQIPVIIPTANIQIIN